MDIDELLKKAMSGETTSDGARMAAFMMAAQFVLHAKPKIFSTAPGRGVQATLDLIHDKGGVIISVDFQAEVIAAYMPKE